MLLRNKGLMILKECMALTELSSGLNSHVILFHVFESDHLHQIN